MTVLSSLVPRSRTVQFAITAARMTDSKAPHSRVSLVGNEILLPVYVALKENFVRLFPYCVGLCLCVHAVQRTEVGTECLPRLLSILLYFKNGFRFIYYILHV